MSMPGGCGRTRGVTLSLPPSPTIHYLTTSSSTMKLTTTEGSQEPGGDLFFLSPPLLVLPPGSFCIPLFSFISRFLPQAWASVRLRLPFPAWLGRGGNQDSWPDNAPHTPPRFVGSTPHLCMYVCMYVCTSLALPSRLSGDSTDRGAPVIASLTSYYILCTPW
jgi:hypothetical protein